MFNLSLNRFNRSVFNMSLPSDSAGILIFWYKVLEIQSHKHLRRWFSHRVCRKSTKLKWQKTPYITLSFYLKKNAHTHFIGKDPVSPATLDLPQPFPISLSTLGKPRLFRPQRMKTADAPSKDPQNKFHSVTFGLTSKQLVGPFRTRLPNDACWRGFNAFKEF